MKRWIHAATQSVEGASVDDMYPIENPQWKLDRGDESTHYDLIDPAYGWATISVYDSGIDEESKRTIYRAIVQPNKKVKMGRAFHSFEMASRWAESQLYQKYAPIESSTSTANWITSKEKGYSMPISRLATSAGTAVVFPYEGSYTVTVNLNSDSYFGNYLENEFKRKADAYKWAEEQLGASGEQVEI